MNDKNEPMIVHTHNVVLDADYSAWLREIKKRYTNMQIRASVKVNSELILFNWQVGRDIVVRKAEEKWGAGIVEQLSLDLKSEFPNTKGFSARNLWYMKKWYQFYTVATSDEYARGLLKSFDETILKNPVLINQLNGMEDAYKKLHQVGAEMELPISFAYVPWRHHIEIITKCKSVEEAIFYMQKVISEGWSRIVLKRYMQADLFSHSGKAITNFDNTLPINQSELAQEITKDTYDLGFLTLSQGYDEKALEDAIEKNITRFLLELGTGFAFVGRQKELIVAGKSRFIDLLFYHIKLRCYVVVDLKVIPFKPEFVGKMNFYVSAVDELMKTDYDNPSIGLLVCSDKDQTEVKWALRRVDTPIGVATYNGVQIEEMEQLLPSAEDIQKCIELAELELRNKM